MASNGIGDLGQYDFMNKGMYPGSQIDRSYYATPTQVPLGAQAAIADYDPAVNPLTGQPVSRFAKGGDVEEKDFDLSYSVRPQGSQEYDPRFMPFQLDNKPLTAPQMAIIRLQAEKELGEGKLRAAMMGNLMTIPGERGVRGTPGNYEVGYKVPAGIGNLDISAMRAMRGTPNGKIPYGVNASYNIPFNEGGIAHFDGETGSQVEEPAAWNPESGQVKLQTLDPEDPYGGMKSVDYTIPTDQIKNFAPTLDPETGKPTGGGAYALNDGSTMHIGRDGIVQAATPARNEYTLNKDGYYQPTGAGLTWNGGLNQLTKKIGGVDVVVDPMFTKGGYQDAKGNLRVDENGVPIPLPPNYLDSGFGQSGLADAAPYIVAGTIGAGAGLAALGGGLTYTGVPASQTLLGSLGSGTLGSTAGISSADLGTTSYIAPSSSVSSGASAFPGVSTADLGTTPYIANQGAPIYDMSAAYNGPLNYAKEKAAAGGMDTYQKLMAGNLAMNALGSGSGGGGSAGPTSTTTTTTAPPQQYPQQQPLVMSPYMMPTNTSGLAYNPTLYSYNTRRAAQGGMMYERGGGISTLGSYSDGGRLLKGPGDGMSDGIPARIGQKQPAALADGEFVVPADVVSHLGNGSTDAGAKQLYKMMDQIRQARTGRKSQGKKINPNKFLPKD
jgi:hypothetical protein